MNLSEAYWKILCVYLARQIGVFQDSRDGSDARILQKNPKFYPDCDTDFQFSKKKNYSYISFHRKCENVRMKECTVHFL